MIHSLEPAAAQQSSKLKSLSLNEIIISVLVLVILNVLAVKLAEYRENVLFFQLLYTARLTMLLFNIALCLYILPRPNYFRQKLWLIFWSGSFISYVVHVYYSFFIYFNGSMSAFYEAQGVFVATLNLVITAWWAFDIFITWFVNNDVKWIHIQKTGIHILLFITFFASTVILHAVDNKEVFVIIMGVILGVSSLICLYIRIKYNIRMKNIQSS